MSREKTTKVENNLFAKNINKLVIDNGGRYVFAESIGVSYEAVRQWCIGEKIPDGKRLLAIREKYRVSIDWLLTGTASSPPAADAAKDFLPAHWPEDMRKACRQMQKIFLSDHDHDVIKPALIASLNAYEASIDNELLHTTEIKELKEREYILKGKVRGEKNTNSGEGA